MKVIDVTDKINYSEFDVGMVNIAVCICGHDFDYADFVINNDKERLVECEKCGRKFYFTNSIRVFMVEE
jgi:hypothetical protein